MNMESKTIENNANELSVTHLNMFFSNFPGTVVITDDKGKILFVNDYCLKIWRDDPKELLGQHVSAFRKNGWAPETGTEYVLEHRVRSTKFFKTKYGDALLTVSIPVFDASKNITGVITFGLIEDVVTDYMKVIKQEKNNVQQLISFLNRNNDSVVAESQKIRDILLFIDNISAIDSTVMLYGESGTGKEVIAKYVHEASKRKKLPYIPVNCAAIPSELMEAEFFGYEKGAFTGASNSGKMGLFQLANKGTLFLDEIGELPLALQSKLLRVIESGEIRRIGSEKIIGTDVRIIAATNRDLSKMVQEGSFRSDLYFRLNILPITIPPLRERPEDIEPLTKTFLAKTNKKYGMNGYFSKNSIHMLKQYSWPGNVRELKNLIERAVVTSRSEIIEIDEAYFSHTHEMKPLQPSETEVISEQNLNSSVVPLKQAMNDFERKYLISALNKYQGDVSESAKHLDISLSGMYKKLAMHGIKSYYV